MAIEKIIFDTDIGGDCDDAGALALIHALCEKGEAELLAVTACYADEYVAGCIDAINTHYHRNVPIGVNYAKGQKYKENADYPGYTKALCENYPNNYKEKKAEDTLTVLRRTLATAEDNSITFIVTGTLSSMARLILSEPDEISSLSGKELVGKKIKRTVVMGGRFFETWPMEIKCGDTPLTAEYNIRGDIPAAQTVCKEWVGELIFSSYEIGFWCVTLRDFIKDSLDTNPAALAYKLFPWSAEGRESWDLTTVLHAVRPNEYYHLHPYGRISIDDTGVTTISPDSTCRHTYLIPKADYNTVRDEIDAIVKSSKYYK